MKSIFITRSGLIALADRADSNHDKSLVFVTTLFAETIKVYTILAEVIAAHEELVRRNLKDKATEVLKIALGGEGITLLDVDPVDLQAAFDLKTKNHTEFSVALVACVVRHHGVRNVFAWEPAYQKANVVVVPRS